MTAFTFALKGGGSMLRRLDRVWVSLGLIFLALIIYDGAQAGRSFVFMMDAFLWLLPFLLVSVALAASLKAAGADRVIALAVARRPLQAIVIASLGGALSPFCSCGVVPLVAGLLAAGVPLPVVMAFWLSSPLMDPEMFVLMSVALPLDFTLAKVAAAIAVGLVAGLVTLWFERMGFLANPLRASAPCGKVCGAGILAFRWDFWREAPRRADFAAEAGQSAHFLTKWMLLAFALESLMVVWLPAEQVAALLGGESWAAIPLAATVGVPAYLNGYAAIPLIGQLMENGMAPGAALAFMIAGGVTSLPAATAVWAIARRGVFFWYLTLALLGALAVGYGYQAILG